MAADDKVTVNDAIDAVAGFFQSIGDAVTALLRALGETDLEAIGKFLVVAFFVLALAVMAIGFAVMTVRGVRDGVRRWRQSR